jgi:4-amino-4-deoxy-L-arabinose transferase-like glycosyltransferase
VPLLLVVAGPWFVAINVATGGAFMDEALGHDLLGKLVGAQEAHGAPPLTHLLILLAGFWPATLFLGGIAARAWRERRDVAVRFLIAWAVPFWILVELVPTKLPQYLLPVYPALALMAGSAALAGTASWRRYDVLFAAIWALVALCLIAGLVEAPIRYGPGLDPIGVAAAAALAILGTLLLARRHKSGASALAICCSLVVFVPLAQFVAPRLDRLFVSDEIATLLRRQLDPVQGPVAAVGYSEPSLVFLLGTETGLLTPQEAAEALAQHRFAAIIVEQRRDTAFRQAYPPAAGPLQASGTVTGLDYSTGKPVSLTLFKNR